MPHQTPRAPLPDGSSGATGTVPRAADNAQWLTPIGLASCVLGAEPITAALDSATQLVTVVIVLILVKARLRRACATPSGSIRLAAP